MGRRDGIPGRHPPVSLIEFRSGCVPRPCEFEQVSTGAAVMLHEDAVLLVVADALRRLGYQGAFAAKQVATRECLEEL